MTPSRTIGSLGLRLCAFLIALQGVGLVPGAQADRSTIAVLGLTSEEGDDRLAAALTEALRQRAASEPTLRLHKSRASLSQMTLLHDCEITDAACRATIGSAIGADEVLYGTVRRAGSRSHEVELRLFDSAAGRERSERRTLTLVQASDTQLAAHASALLRALLAPEPEPAPQVAETPPAALTPDEVPEEEPAPEQVSIEPEPEPEPEGHFSNDWLGYTLLGVAAVSTGLTIYSWTQIERAADDQSLKAYREAIGEDKARGGMGAAVDDVCGEADDDVRYGQSAEALAKVREACSRGETYDVLQYVFMGAALLSAGAGVYLLLDDEGPAEQAARSNAPTFHAGVRRGGGLLQMRLKF